MEGERGTSFPIPEGSLHIKNKAWGFKCLSRNHLLEDVGFDIVRCI